MNPNIELTDETTEFCGHVLHRIKAKHEFTDGLGRTISEGTRGGWVERENNLNGKNCWVSDEAKVFENALIDGSATISDGAKVYGDAAVEDDAIVGGCAQIYGNAIVSGCAHVYGSARVYDFAEVRDSAEVSGFSQVRAHSTIKDCAVVRDTAVVMGTAVIYSNAEIRDTAVIDNYVHIGDDIVIKGDAEILSSSHFAYFKNFWSSGRIITYTSSNKMWSVGCFYGTGKALIKKAYNDSINKGICYEALVNAVEHIEKVKKGKLIVQRFCKWLNKHF